MEWVSGTTQSALVDFGKLKKPRLQELHPSIQVQLLGLPELTRYGARILVAYSSYVTGKPFSSLNLCDVLSKRVESAIYKSAKPAALTHIRRACRALGNEELFPIRERRQVHPYILQWLGSSGIERARHSKLSHPCMQFLEWLCRIKFISYKPHEIPLDHLNREILIQYRQYLVTSINRNILGQGAARSYMNSVLRWLRWSSGAGHIRTIETHGLTLSNEINEKRKLPSHTEISTFISEACALFPKQQTVIKLYFLLMLATGARPTELHRLKLRDMDHDTHRIYLQSKNGNPRWMPVDDVLWSELSNYVSHLNCQGEDDFVILRTAEDKPISYPWANYIFQKVRQTTRIFIDGQLAFRHRFATDCFEANVDVSITRYCMGHRDLQMLPRYQHTSNHHLKRTMDDTFSSMNWWR